MTSLWKIRVVGQLLYYYLNFFNFVKPVSARFVYKYISTHSLTHRFILLYSCPIYEFNLIKSFCATNHGMYLLHTGIHNTDSNSVIIAILHLSLSTSMPVFGNSTISGRYIKWWTQSRTIEYRPQYEINGSDLIFLQRSIISNVPIKLAR